MKNEKYRTTKDWRRIKIWELDNYHLTNIYNMIDKKSKEWVVIIRWWWSTFDDIRYDEDILYWEDVRNYNEVFKEIRKEFNKRFK